MQEEMKKVKVKRSYIIVFVLIALLGLVLYVGTYSYTNISRVVDDIEAATVSDGRLVQTKNLLREISSAENSVKTYGLTKNSDYLDQYYNAINASDKIMDALIQSSGNSAYNTSLDLDLMDSLITKKFIILNSYLDLQNDYRVGIALDKVIANIETKAGSPEAKQSDGESKSSKERSFIQRLFNNKDKPVNKVEIGQIDAEIRSIKNQENRINRSIVAKEVELIMADKEVNAQIDSILYDFEIAENQYIALRSDKAAKEIRVINQQITLLFINTGLLVLFVIILITRYVRANNRFGVALERAKTRAEQLAETKERFLNNMSHEIRTPMNAISGFIKQLSSSKLDKKQREHVDIINKSSDYLLHIVDEVLVYNKLQNNQSKIDLRGFELDGLINDLKQVMTPSARKKGVALVTDVYTNTPNVLVGDPYKLNQILINVLGNAIKFTTKGSVNVQVSHKAKTDKQIDLIFKIVDTGIGMTDEQMTRIFEEFEQAEVTTTRQFGGTGLGLSITKKLVHLLNGTITVDSKKGIGTTFTITLPFDIGDQSDIFVIRGEESENTVLQDLSILVVDDEVYNRKLLMAILGKHDINLTEAENGIEAYEEVKRNRYDVVLMDTRMPVMDGIEATSKIRALPDKIDSQVPIIAISAAVSESDQQKYKAVGMNGFLPKPFKEADLIRQIGSVTGRQIAQMKEPSIETPIEDDALDFTHLNDLSNGDTTFYIDMLKTFVETIENGTSGIKKAVEDEDIDMVAEYAHRIASPCKHLNAMNLYHQLKAIENGIRNDELSMPEVTDLVSNVYKTASDITEKVKQKIIIEETNATK